MTFFKELLQAIEDGISGKNRGVSLGMDRLERYVSLRKKLYYMIIGSTGSGKSSFLHDAFILNPLDVVEKSGMNIKLKYILFSMERSKSYFHAKWLVRKIFMDEGILIPIGKLLSWYGESPSKSEKSLIDRYEDYFDFLEEHIEIYEGSRSPNDIYRIVKNYAEANGREETINDYKKIYIPNDDKEQVVVCADHFGLTKVVRDYPTKKQAIDKVSENFQYFRDYLGYSCIGVNQLNRDLSNPIYQKMDSFEPHLDNTKETGTTTEAADIVLSLFEPIRYGTNDKYYGDVSKFRDPETGHKYFRNIKILKNTYGADDIGVGTVFQGEIGAFKELPRSKEIKEKWTEHDFQSIFDNTYFRNE